MAELLRVKGLVEGEGDKLLNSNFKNGRPLVSTSMNEPPTSSSKLNGGSDPESPRFRPETRNPEETRGRASSISADRSGSERDSSRDPKDSPNHSNMRLPMFNPQAPGMPPMPMFPIPGMFPANLLGAREGLTNRVNRDDADSANEREGSPSPGSGNKRRKVASGSGGSSSSKESGPLGHDQPLVSLIFFKFDLQVSCSKISKIWSSIQVSKMKNTRYILASADKNKLQNGKYFLLELSNICKLRLKYKFHFALKSNKNARGKKVLE